MSFFSGTFWAFIVLLFVLYFLAGKKAPSVQWCILLIGSMLFYASNSLHSTIFLLTSIAATWGLPLLMTHSIKCDVLKEGQWKKICLALCLLINIGLLVALKYHKLPFRTFDWNGDWIFIPLGISYYTFQSTGYCLDVYWGIVEPEKNFFKYALYVSFFPQISQGPIGTYAELAPQFFKPHRFEYTRFTSGLERVVLGFFKKIVVANNLAIVVNQIYENYSAYSGMTLLFATVLYGLQLYADFSGYMDIALGISECLDITLAENFRTPYFSRSIAEYWRRWHISLGAWFRNYLYYPVLRSRIVLKCGKIMKKYGYKKLSRYMTTSIGLFVTWLVIGLWHGAAWKFVGYGLFHGSIIIAGVWLGDTYKRTREWLFIHEKSKLWAIFQVFRTYFIVNIGYVMFRADGFRMALSIYKIIFTRFWGGEFRTTMGSFGRAYWILMGIGLAFLLLVELLETRSSFTEWLNHRCILIKWPILYFMIAFTILYLFNQEADAINFIYFNF